MPLRPAPKLRRWAPGDSVNSAARLNEVVDAVALLREQVGGRQLSREAPAPILRTVVIQNLTGPATGQILGEWKAGSAEGVVIYLWPKLYPTVGYTYTSNNLRKHTASGIDEEMVPQLTAGEVLRVEYFYHPTAAVFGWFDTNRTARMWGEVVTPP